MSAFTIPSIFTAVDKFSAPVKRMNGTLSSFSSRANAGISRLDRNLRKLTPSLGGMGAQMASFASAAAVGALLNNGIQAIKEYEVNMASLQAITGVTDEVMGQFKASVNSVASDTKRSAGEVAKAFELVGSAKPELLKSAAALGEVTKQAIILSQASGEELETSVQSLTGTLNQFGLGSDSALRVIDTLAAGAQAGAAAVPLISESLDKFGTVAASMNVNVQESVGLIETLAEKNIKGAEAGTKLRNVLTKMATAKSLPKEALDQMAKFGVNLDIVADSAKPLNVRLAELSKIQNDATALSKVFGTENLVAGQVLLQNVDKVEAYTKAVSVNGVAQKQASLNTGTLSSMIEQLSAKWENLFTSNQKASRGLELFKSLIRIVTNNLETIVGGALALAAVFVTLKAVILAARGAMLIYNIILGITGALSGTASIAIGANSVALGAYAIASKIATIAASAWAVALNLGIWPITLIALGIAALIALVVVIIKKWDQFGAALNIILGPIGLVISMIQSLRSNWEMVKDSFTNGGILEGIKSIGKVLIDAVLAPIQQLLELMSNIPGMADLAGGGALKIQEIRAGLGLNTGPVNKESELINPKAVEQKTLTERLEKNSTSTLDINVKDKEGLTSVNMEGNNPMINLSSTVGNF